MHYYAVHDDADGVQVVFEHTENTELAMGQRPGDLDALGRPCDPAFVGLYGFPMSPSRMSMVQLRPRTGDVNERAHLYEPGAPTSPSSCRRSTGAWRACRVQPCATCSTTGGVPRP